MLVVHVSFKRMKRAAFLFAALLVIGAGCSERNIENRRTAWKDVRGMDLILKASVQSGSPVIVNRPAINRRFRSQIGPTFTDYNGSYRMSDGSSIEIQLGVSGTPDSDREQLKQIEYLSDFEEGELEGWNITTAYDEKDGRWILRAAQRDPGLGAEGYHVIECLATSTSNFVFWDGCRTTLEGAQILADTGSAL